MADENDGASVGELLIEACRRDNTDLLTEVLEGRADDEIARLLNETKTVTGNHLYHEAASRGNSEIIDMLLDQPDFECDPINRSEGDTPLHSAIRWINGQPAANREFGHHLVSMMLEAGSSTRVRNKGRLTPLQLVDPRNTKLRELIQQHEYAAMNAGDFIDADDDKDDAKKKKDKKKEKEKVAVQEDEDDDNAEFSGSDEEERAEWERRRKAKA